MTRICLALFPVFCLAAAQDDLKAADKAVREGLQAGSAKTLEAGVRAAVKINDAKALEMLLKYAARPGGEEAAWMELYWLLLNGAAAMSAPEAMEAASDFILKNKARIISRDLMVSLIQQGHPGTRHAMHRILEKGEDDLRVMAADHLVDVGDRSSIDLLIATMKAHGKKNDTLNRRCGDALQAITGQLFGDSLTNWDGWWGANKGNPELKLPERVPGKRSTGTAADTLTGSREGEYERLLKGKVLVLQAGSKYCCGHSHDLDNIDRMAQKLGLTVDVIDKGDFENPEKNKVPNLDDYVAILSNCTHIREHCNKLKCPDCKPGAAGADRLSQCACPKNFHPSSTYTLSKRGIEMVKLYVEKGGYVFAEDWCMEDFVGKAWGDYVTHGPTRPEETVTVLPKSGMASHPYLRKIFFKAPTETRGTVTETDLAKVDHQWKIDKDTRCIKIVDPARVTVLLVSPELKKYAQGNEAVAVTFAVGGKDGKKPAVASGGQVQQDRGQMSGGRVMYVLSHFGKQKSEEDEYTLQNLMLNFLFEASERRAHYETRKKEK
jgi:hypothetical protein